MRSASGLLSLSSFLFFCLSSLPRPLPPLPPPPSCLLLEATVQILRPLLLLLLVLLTQEASIHRTQTGSHYFGPGLGPPVSSGVLVRCPRSIAPTSTPAASTNKWFEVFEFNVFLSTKHDHLPRQARDSRSRR